MFLHALKWHTLTLFGLVQKKKKKSLKKAHFNIFNNARSMLLKGYVWGILVFLHKTGKEKYMTQSRK